MKKQDIEELLQRYYPKGLSKDKLEYWDSKEYKCYELLLVDTVHNTGSDYREWQGLLKHLSENLNVTINDFTDGQLPGFFAHLTGSPSKTKLELPGLKEDICIYKSILSDYFCILGTRELHWQNSMGASAITPLEAFISPSEFTSNLYDSLFQFFSSYAQDLEFLSYEKGQEIQLGLSLPFTDKTPCTLFDALLGPFDFSGYDLIGNIAYEKE